MAHFEKEKIKKKVPDHHGRNEFNENYKKNCRKMNTWLIAGGVLTILLLISIFTGGLHIGPGLFKGGAQQKIASEVSTVTVSGGNNIDNSKIKGDKNAPVTIVEFSDYECSFCRRFYSQTFGLIDDKYIKTGKVKFIYKNFPLNIHPNAQKAAEAAECAGGQGKYYEMYDELFKKGVQGGATTFKRYAQNINLDTTKFNKCLDSGAMASKIHKDVSEGQKQGVSGTPAFFINGIKIVGAQPFSVFEQAIERELAK